VLNPLQRIGRLAAVQRLRRIARQGPLGRWRNRLRSRRVAQGGLRPGEVDDFLVVARQSFVQMQAAWDRADLRALGQLTTEPLLQELRDQLEARGPAPNRTEVLSLDARLLSLEELREAYVASVEFSGVIREQLGERAAPFRELWLLANFKAADRGWRLARVQSLS
jgi:predicted lipid-binding transport protein (Tim44 family)